MTLIEYLGLLPLEDLKSIAANLGLKPRLISRGRLLRAIPQKLLQKDRLGALVEALSESERRVLTAILLGGMDGRSFHDQNRHVAWPADLKASLYKLLSHGLIFGCSHKGSPHVIHYHVPQDLRLLLQHYLEQQLAQALVGRDGRLPLSHRPDLSLQRDLFTLLHFLKRQPARLTAKGVLYKRVQDHLSALFEVPETPSSGPVRDTPGHYPPRFDFMLRYGMERNLIYQSDRHLKSSPAVAEWLDLSQLQRADDLFGYWYQQQISRQLPGSSLLTLLRWCRTLPEMNGDSFLRLLQLYCPEPLRQNHPAVEDLDAADRLLREMVWIGLIRLETDLHDRIKRFRVTTLGSDLIDNGAKKPDEQCQPTYQPLVESRFIVQPTFEVLVPQYLDFSIRAGLERFAELEKSGAMASYRLTKESVYRALEEGLAKGAIIDFLHHYSDKTIPQNLLYSIEEWEESYGKVYFLEAFLICTDSPEMAQQLKSDRIIGPLLQGEVSPTALILRRADYPGVLQRLQKLGQMPRSLDTTGSSEQRSRFSLQQKPGGVVQPTFQPQPFGWLMVQLADRIESATVLCCADALPGWTSFQETGATSGAGARAGYGNDPSEERTA